MIKSAIKSVMWHGGYNVLSTYRLSFFVRHCTTSKSGKPSWQTWHEEHLDEEQEKAAAEKEIEKKRNKARLPERVYQANMKKEMPSLEAKYCFEKRYLRRMYGTYGKSTGLNPGIMWPTKDELLECIGDDKMFHPPLQEMLRNVKEKRLEEARIKKEREEFIEKNMAKLDTLMKNYFEKQTQKEAEAKELQEKQEKRIEEVCEFLGYKVEPNDPRFQVALEQKEQEEEKALKEQKKKDKYERLLAKLTGMSELLEKSETTDKKVKKE